jgi:hypothetical protein
MPMKHKEKDLIKSNSIHLNSINIPYKTYIPYMGVYVSKTCKSEVETIKQADKHYKWSIISLTKRGVGVCGGNAPPTKFLIFFIYKLPLHIFLYNFTDKNTVTDFTIYPYTYLYNFSRKNIGDKVLLQEKRLKPVYGICI